MKIGDVVRYKPYGEYMTSEGSILGLIVGMHDTDSLFLGHITLYHVEWFNDGSEDFRERHAITHEAESSLEVIQ